MATGCQGPFCHGTGGWCGCNCKCCPPPCCPVVSARFQCVLNPPCSISVCCCPDPIPTTLYVKFTIGPVSANCPPLYDLSFPIIWDSVAQQWYGETTISTDPFCGPVTSVVIGIRLKCVGTAPSCYWETAFSMDGVTGPQDIFPNIFSSAPTLVSCNPFWLEVGYTSWPPPLCPPCGDAPGNIEGGWQITANNPFPFMMGQANLPEPPQPMPTFDKKPIFSKNKKFLFGGPFPTSTSLPVQAICVPVFAGSPGVCCFEVIDGGIIAVGNGYVNAPTSIVADNGCNSYKVKINGAAPPVWVNDCQAVNITLEPVETCCVCQLVDVSCGPCTDGAGMLYLPQNRLWKKLVNRSNNKIRINPETGLPYIYIDKAELLRRIIERRQKLRRKK